MTLNKIQKIWAWSLSALFILGVIIDGLSFGFPVQI